MENNDYCFLWAEDEQAQSVLIKHPVHGRQSWRLSYLIVPFICSLTGQLLQPHWLCYTPPANAANGGEVIGQWALGKLLTYSGKKP